MVSAANSLKNPQNDDRAAQALTGLNLSLNVPTNEVCEGARLGTVSPRDDPARESDGRRRGGE